MSASLYQSIEAFRAGTKEERDRALSALVETLRGSFVREHGDRLRHEATGIAFVVVPGGCLRMGITPADIAAAEPLIDSDDTRSALAASARIASPVHAVEIEPFLCSVRPLGREDVVRLSEGRIRRDTLLRAEAIALAAGLGLGLPSEAELEWIARDGADRAFCVDLLARQESADDEGQLPSSFGLEAPLMSCWAADTWHDSYEGAPGTSEPWLGGDSMGVYRAGPLLPVQSRSELLTGLSGLRGRGLEPDEDGQLRSPDCWMRLRAPFVT